VSWQVANASSNGFAHVDDDEPLLLDALARAGLRARRAVWNDPEESWTDFDLVVVRSTWDYVDHLDQFLAWIRSVRHLANPAAIIEWNLDKRYLAELAAAGVPTVPTTWIGPAVNRPGGPSSLPSAPERALVTSIPAGQVVVKPSVGNGAREAGRYGENEQELVQAHVDRLLASGRTVMVQPYLDNLDASGETGIVVIGGQVSHAIEKSPRLTALSGHPAPYESRRGIARREPTAAELDLAALALAQVPGGPEQLLYARVDMAPGPDGEPVLMELEVAEPSLYLVHAPGSADKLAAAIVERIEATC